MIETAQQMCFLSDVIAEKVSMCLTSIHKSILGKGNHNLYII